MVVGVPGRAAADAGATAGAEAGAGAAFRDELHAAVKSVTIARSQNARLTPPPFALCLAISIQRARASAPVRKYGMREINRYAWSGAVGRLQVLLEVLQADGDGVEVGAID